MHATNEYQGRHDTKHNKNTLRLLRHSTRVSNLFDYLPSNLRRTDHDIVWSTSVVHSRLFAKLTVLMLEKVTENT